MKATRMRESPLTLLLLLTTCLALLGAQCLAQSQPPAQSRLALGTGASSSEGMELAETIREVDSPAFRAYLYSRVARWLWQSAGDNTALRESASHVSVRAIADIHLHESEIAPAPASEFYEELLGIVRQHSPAEASRVERMYPLASRVNRAAQVKAGADLHQALTGASDPQANREGFEQAVRLINSGVVPIMSLHKELLLQDQLNSPALPQLLSATLALEERTPGAIPLQNLHLLSHLYLRERTPTDLRARFLATVSRATRLTPDMLRADPGAAGSAIQLLRASLPQMQTLTPTLYAEAAARLASMSSGMPTENDVFGRIRASADPLSKTIEEARSTSDERLKCELLEAAAQMAREKGKLRMAVELMLSADEARDDASGQSPKRDAFLERIVNEALTQKDIETAKYAESAVKSPLYRVSVALKLARHYAKAGDGQAAAASLTEAIKSLDKAPDSSDKAIAYFRLAADGAEIEAARTSELLKVAVKSANTISRPRGESLSKFSFGLFPLAESVTSTFRRLAAKDRASASDMAAELKAKELKVAARLGVYSAGTP